MGFLTIQPSEKEAQAAILDYLRFRHFAWRNNTGAFCNQRDGFYRFGKVGSGDILGVKSKTGQFFSIEVKREGKKPTPAQLDFMESVMKCGGLAFVAYSVQDVIDWGL